VSQADQEAQRARKTYEKKQRKHMSISDTHLDHLATTLAQSNSWERMEYFLPLMRLLANGKPISTEHLAMIRLMLTRLARKRQAEQQREQRQQPCQSLSVGSALAA
jgi:hypothetical protein